MWRDFQLAARLLAKDRLFTIAVTTLLAVGLGANLSLFALVDALLLRPLPVRDPERLVRLVTVRPPLAAASEFFFEEYEAWRKHATGLADLLAWSEQDRFVRVGGVTERLRIHLVTGNFFEVLGTKPTLGHLLTPADDTPAPTQTAVLSYAYWQRHFRGDPSVLGQTIAIEGSPFTIIGVTPKGFNGLTVETGPELRVPMSAAKLWPKLMFEGRIECSVVGRLRPGASLRSARDEADAIRLAVGRELAKMNQEGSFGSFELESAWRGVSRMRKQYSAVLQMLMAGLGLLLLLVCANVAGLMMSRIASRQSELAVRMALGATRRSVVQLLLAEGFLLMLAGAAGALVLSAILVPRLTTVLPPIRDLSATRLPLTIELVFDWRLFCFAVAASAAAMMIFALGPALLSVRRNVHPLLREAARGHGGGSGRQFLVVAQIALATVLLASSGLTLLTIQRLNRMDTGFVRDGVITFSVAPHMAGLNQPQASQLRQRLLAEAHQLPGTVTAAIASRGLMRGTGMKMTVARTGEAASPEDFLNTSINAVSPGYFAALGIPLLAGNLFADPHETVPGDVDDRVVNHTFVRRFFANRDPIGQTFGSVAFGKGVAKSQFRIVGVVGDARYRSLREPIQPTVYGPFRGNDSFILHVRSSAPPSTVVSGMRAALSRADPQLSFIEVTTLASEVEASLWAERTAAFLAAGLAISATLVAAAGVYALLAFSVQQRRREIGIRLALGAPRSSIAWLFGGRALALAGLGAALGFGLLRFAAPLMKTLLYEVEPSDPRAISGAIACVALFAVIGALTPSILAAHAQPSQALREP